MANRYLRGTGARNWNDTNNWSETSGGAGGASVPTSADSVIFDANSGTGTITINAIASMLDFICTNIGALTLANSAYAFNVYGSLTLHTNLTVNFTSTGYLYFKSTTTGKNITSNGNTQGWNRIYFDGVGGEWTNQDNWNIGATAIYLTNGAWNQVNYDITTSSDFVTAAGTKVLTLGSGVFSIRQWANAASTGFTFNKGTSTVVVSGAGFIQYGSDTFYNLTISGIAATYAYIYFNLNVTVSNILTITGNNASNYRVLVASNTIGTPRTITVNGLIVASNVDFRDITLAGTANRDLSTITGGSGDCGGNSGITFTTGVTQYYKHTGGSATLWSDANKWFSDTDLTVAGRVPLPQDDATFLANSFTQACTLSVNVPRIGRSLDMSAVNVAVTQSFANAIECYGNYVLGSNITPTGGVVLNLMGRGNFDLNTYERTISGILTIYLGTYTNRSNINSAAFIQQFSGTFDYNDFNYTANSVQHRSGIVNLGDGIHTYLQGTTGIVAYFPAPLVVYSEGSLLRFVPASGSGNIVFDSGGRTFNKVQFSGSHTGNFDITGNTTFAELIIDKGRKVRFTGGSSQTVAKTSIQGTPAEPVVLTSTNTTPFNLVHSGSGYHQWDYVNVSYCNATANRFYAGERSTNGGNNTGVLFRNYLLRANRILKRWIKPINFE